MYFYLSEQKQLWKSMREVVKTVLTDDLLKPGVIKLVSLGVWVNEYIFCFRLTEFWAFVTSGRVLSPFSETSILFLCARLKRTASRVGRHPHVHRLTHLSRFWDEQKRICHPCSFYFILFLEVGVFRQKQNSSFSAVAFTTASLCDRHENHRERFETFWRLAHESFTNGRSPVRDRFKEKRIGTDLFRNASFVSSSLRIYFILANNGSSVLFCLPGTGADPSLRTLWSASAEGSDWFTKSKPRLCRLCSCF